MNQPSKSTKDFLSLIEAALLYFDQTEPISPQVYQMKKFELEEKLKQAEMKNSKLQESLSNLSSSVSLLKHQRSQIDIQVKSLSADLLSQQEIIKKKDINIQKTRSELIKLQNQSILKYPRRLYSDSRILDNHFVKLSEESEELNGNEMLDYDLSERFHTHH
jgi:chromosome segregation ATPase